MAAGVLCRDDHDQRVFHSPLGAAMFVSISPRRVIRTESSGCLVLYFDRIPLWGKFVTTILVGLLVGALVMFVVKPRMKSSIERASKTLTAARTHSASLSSLVMVRKKEELDSRGEEPQLTKTDGRFETYTGKYVLLVRSCHAGSPVTAKVRR